MAHLRIQEGQYTQRIYGLIKEQNYGEVVQILNYELQSHPKSRAALSLLGFCYYRLQDFQAAADCYEQLVQLHPDVHDYQFYYSQCLYKACMFPEATKASCQLEHEEYQTKVLKLQAAIKYAEDDLPNAKTLVEQCPSDDPDTEFNMACILFKEKRFTEAVAKFNTVLQVMGYRADTCYCLALCHYQLKQYAASLKYISEVIERGIRDHPELSVGMQTEGVDIRSVGNSSVLHGTQLVETFNLRAAIEYQLKNFDAAQDALTDMPPRAEEELDPVTLHNIALMNMDQNPTNGFEKLQFLLQQVPCPPETFANLLLLYIKHDYYDLAADVLAENSHLTFKCLSTYLYDFIDTKITQQTSPDEAFQKLDVLATHLTERLRKLTKHVQEHRKNHDEEAVKRCVEEYDEALENYVPVLMAQARIYWDREDYSQVEKIFRKSVEFCNEHDVWKLNVAHVLFMQEVKFKEAIGFYEAIVKKNHTNLLSISAVILANLCVSYIMTSQTEEAEQIMKKIEKEEEDLSYDDPDRKMYHLCIVNLVIGTLYCAKGNYEFGASRVMKSLEPYNKKLGTDTWFYAKRCLCSLIENMAKHMILLKDATIHDIIRFLEQCEAHGRSIACRVEQPLGEHTLEAGKNTVTFEARLLKSLFLRLT
ncbi:Tetratricopeptide repeat protein 30A [Geodia barretti]|uniref:Tetratricopeptide repeat protein 30 n=1 Tax=Geodia barretti TaxID=519541 RepID=A0AA35SA21_GEOBA|nr:Tetratricopeptide repeat protein 30A [Geodia barretti]